MATSVLLTGGSGLLGTWLRRTAPAGVDLRCLVHRTAVEGPTVTADLRDADATLAAIVEATPDLVLHAAYAVDESSIVGATEHMAMAAAAVGADVVLISTDVVFGGDGVRRHEDDPPDPVSDYGRWKARAEGTVRAGPRGATSAVVRLPLVVSTDPDDGAVAAIRAAAARGEATTWFDDELRQPAMADELAAAIWQIVGLPATERAGAWHLMGPERLSRLEIARRAGGELGIDADLVLGEPTPPGLARPRDLHLGDDRARHLLRWAPRPIFSVR